MECVTVVGNKKTLSVIHLFKIVLTVIPNNTLVEVNNKNALKIIFNSIKI